MVRAWKLQWSLSPNSHVVVEVSECEPALVPTPQHVGVQRLTDSPTSCVYVKSSVEKPSILILAGRSPVVEPSADYVWSFGNDVWEGLLSDHHFVLRLYHHNGAVVLQDHGSYSGVYIKKDATTWSKIQELTPLQPISPSVNTFVFALSQPIETIVPVATPSSSLPVPSVLNVSSTVEDENKKTKTAANRRKRTNKKQRVKQRKLEEKEATTSSSSSSSSTNQEESSTIDSVQPTPQILLTSEQYEAVKLKALKALKETEQEDDKHDVSRKKRKAKELSFHRKQLNEKKEMIENHKLKRKEHVQRKQLKKKNGNFKNGKSDKHSSKSQIQKNKEASKRKREQEFNSKKNKCKRGEN